MADGAGRRATTTTLAAVLFCIAAATDWVDGRLARRWGVTTKLGSFLDTTADKLLVSGRADRAARGRAGVALDRRDHRRPRARDHRPARRDRGRGHRDAALACSASSRRPSSSSRSCSRSCGPGEPVGGLYVDEWAMIAAAAITVWSAVDYLARVASLAVDRPARRDDGPRLPHGRQRRHRRRAAAPACVERGDEVVALARSDEAAAALAGARRAGGARRRARRGRRSPRGDARAASSLYHVAGINTMCPADPAELFHVNVRGAEAAVRAAARAGVRRVVLTSSAAALGEARGHGRQRGLAAPRQFLSVYERSKHEGEVAAFAAARRAGASSSSRSTRPRSRARAGRAAPAGSSSPTSTAA